MTNPALHRPTIRIVQTALRGEPVARPVVWLIVHRRAEANRALRELRRQHPDNRFEAREGSPR